ncbi:MAG: phage tail family protein [Clostridia bacterium]|nr:phage tail family protein [Clostridia bacterium]
MPYTLTAETASGERLTLTEYRSAYQVTYTGLGPVNADVITSSLGLVDGDKYNSARVGRRNVVLTVTINGNVEENRIRLYHWFTPKQWVKLHYKNGSRDVYTEGVVETFEVNQFTMVQQVQISIICPQPYLIGAEEIVKDISGITAMFSFPFAIEAAGVPFSDLSGAEYAILHNSGDEATGFVISVYARATVTGPVIYNAVTNEAFRIRGTLESGHTLTIDTRSGSKRLTITSPSGEVMNALYRKQAGSVWLQLQPGDNYIAYSAEADAAAMLVTLRHNDLYVGV